MNETPVKKSLYYHIYPRDFEKPSEKGFVNIDNGSMGGSNWTCFIVKGNETYYFDSFGGQPDKFLLK